MFHIPNLRILKNLIKNSKKCKGILICSILLTLFCSQFIDVSFQLLHLKYFVFHRKFGLVSSKNGKILQNLDDTSQLGYLEIPSFASENATSTDLKIMRSVIILIPSSHQNYENRNAIRKTWAQKSKGRYFFLIGCQDNVGTYSEELLNERKNHLDMVFLDNVLENSEESEADNLTMKVLLGFFWALKNFPDVRYFMRVEDNSYLKVTNLYQMIGSFDHDSKPTPKLYIGSMITHGLVEKSGPRTDLDYTMSSFYPPYASSCSGYLLTRPIVERFRSRFFKKDSNNKEIPSNLHVFDQENEATLEKDELETLFFYKNDDTAIGIWINEDPDLKDSTSLINFSNKYFPENSEYLSCNYIKNKVCLDVANHRSDLVSFGSNYSVNEIFKCHKIIVSDMKLERDSAKTNNKVSCFMKGVRCSHGQILKVEE